jgi:4'-phosphopantetheinyl transferase
MAMSVGEELWQKPGAGAHLPPDHVHVWRATLQQTEPELSRLIQVLSSSERARADRFYFEADRKRHIIGRGLSRVLLGQSLGIPASALEFEHNEHGKPALRRDIHPPLSFNISHSGDLVLVATAAGRSLGIDVERMQPTMATAEIAARFFSVQERATLAALPADERCAAFFACWTRKEAYLKARGDGLSLPLDQFDVAFAPGETPRLLQTRHDPAEASRWTLYAFDPGHGCQAALAVEGSGHRLRLWDW